MIDREPLVKVTWVELTAAGYYKEFKLGCRNRRAAQDLADRLLYRGHLDVTIDGVPAAGPQQLVAIR